MLDASVGWLRFNDASAEVQKHEGHWYTCSVYQTNMLSDAPESKKPLTPLGIKGLAFLVAKGGIEPPTRGFSIRCSTN